MLAPYFVFFVCSHREIMKLQNFREIIFKLLFKTVAVMIISVHTVITPAVVSAEDYIDFADMGSYDLAVQKNKLSQFGMVAQRPQELAQIPVPKSETCDASCGRSFQYLQRVVKSLLRQMRVHSHLFGPGEAITIDLQAELKYDDYVTLNKFATSQAESEQYLYRIDEIMSNLIHVVEHTSSRFDFLEKFNPFQGFYSSKVDGFKFVVILLTLMVICCLIVILMVKTYYTPAVRNQMLYGFLIIFILSCVWTYSSLYEDKKAEIHAHLVQSNELPPKECDYGNLEWYNSIWYFVRSGLFKYKDQCQEHYTVTMTDPLWKVNPMSAISYTAGFFIFSPLDYVGAKLGSFYNNFIANTPLILKPFLLGIAVLITVLILYGPFRISTPLLTIEPAWRPQVPALEQSSQNTPLSRRMIGLVRNEIMERPDGPVVKSVRDATTDMDGFHEYLTDEGTDELEVTSPFARFTQKESSSSSRQQTSDTVYVPRAKCSTKTSSTNPMTDEEPGPAKCVVYTSPPVRIEKQNLQKSDNSTEFEA